VENKISKWHNTLEKSILKLNLDKSILMIELNVIKKLGRKLNGLICIVTLHQMEKFRILQRKSTIKSTRLLET
jgi:hypothetical protein